MNIFMNPYRMRSGTLNFFYDRKTMLALGFDTVHAVAERHTPRSPRVIQFILMQEVDLQTRRRSAVFLGSALWKFSEKMIPCPHFFEMAGIRLGRIFGGWWWVALDAPMAEVWRWAVVFILRPWYFRG